MTRARAKLLQAKVNSLLSLCDFDTPLDGLLLHTHTLCIIRYEEKDPANGGAPAEEAKYPLSPAVLPELAAGTTAQRHYRSQQTTPTEAKYSLSPAVLPDLEQVLPVCGTTAPYY